jgi:two-component system sensor histidine kinase PhoQ
VPIFRSLRARVLLWVCVALTVLFAITIVGLDMAFQRSTDRAIEDLLEVQLLGLIALAEETPDQEISLPPDSVVNPQFAVADSGLYGGLWDADGVAVWQSASLLGREIFLPSWPVSGEQVSFTVAQPDLPPLSAHAMGITWDFSDGSSLPYTFGVAVSLAPYVDRQTSFRRNLIGWFGGITVTMLIVLTGLLTFVLRPLRRLEYQVREVEAGTRQQLAGEMPSELAGLAGNLNALIATERRRLVRYRNLLDDLAHSLKTPLAAMRTLLNRKGHETLTEDLDREVDRMDQRVSYPRRQAARAARSSRSPRRKNPNRAACDPAGRSTPSARGR